MKTCLKGFAAAALLLTAASFPAYAEDAQAPAAATTMPPAAPSATTPSDTKPAFVPRPAPVPNATETTPEATTAEPPRHHRHYVRHDYRYRRYAYWEPFPVYLPHFYRNRITWNRVRWFW